MTINSVIMLITNQQPAHIVFNRSVHEDWSTIISLSKTSKTSQTPPCRRYLLSYQPKPSHFSTVICNKHLTRGNYKLQTIWPWSTEYGAALSHPMEAGSGHQGQHLLYWAYSRMGSLRLVETSGDLTWPESFVDLQQCSLETVEEICATITLHKQQI